MFKDLPSNPHPPQIQKHLPGSIHVRLPMSKHIINQSSSLFFIIIHHLYQYGFYISTSLTTMTIHHYLNLQRYHAPTPPSTSPFKSPRRGPSTSGAGMGPPTAMQHGGAGRVFLLANYARNPSSLPTPLFRGY